MRIMLFLAAALTAQACGASWDQYAYVEGITAMRPYWMEADEWRDKVADLSLAVGWLDKRLDGVEWARGATVEWEIGLDVRGTTTWLSFETGERKEYGRITIRRTQSCTDNTYVPIHELLHVYAIRGLEADWEDNALHTVPGVFAPPHPTVDHEAFVWADGRCWPL